mmetsp:Transcript_35738/g.114974  ORF Transcript_35738/g.114974 Transcript_35738/m.114974 type:complete len:244 (+) Transcript_35738:620-1351(+)
MLPDGGTEARLPPSPPPLPTFGLHLAVPTCCARRPPSSDSSHTARSRPSLRPHHPRTAARRRPTAPSLSPQTRMTPPPPTPRRHRPRRRSGSAAITAGRVPWPVSLKVTTRPTCWTQPWAQPLLRARCGAAAWTRRHSELEGRRGYLRWRGTSRRVRGVGSTLGWAWMWTPWGGRYPSSLGTETGWSAWKWATSEIGRKGPTRPPGTTGHPRRLKYFPPAALPPSHPPRTAVIRCRRSRCWWN